MDNTVESYTREKSFFRLIPFWDSLSRRIRYVKNLLYVAKMRHSTISKKKFIENLKNAIENNVGYAAGKIGSSEQFMMYYEILLQKEYDSTKIRKYERDLEFYCLKQMGIFPFDPAFYLQYSKFYVSHVKNMDCLGLFYYPEELELINYYGLKSDFIYYIDQEPDRSSPSDVKNCYLQYFRDKKILIICPFAHLLKERANRETFEAVWSKTGKKWFYPKEVQALEFPYGFAGETHQKYSTAMDLFQEITDEIDKRDFDVALIGAAGLAIPIASYVKSLGKIGISLGGHLQFLFGVIGKRWREREYDREAYFNRHWIDMPANYKPKETDVCDSGAYW